MSVVLPGFVSNEKRRLVLIRPLLAGFESTTGTNPQPIILMSFQTERNERSTAERALDQFLTVRIYASQIFTVNDFVMNRVIYNYNQLLGHFLNTFLVCNLGGLDSFYEKKRPPGTNREAVARR